MDPLVTETQLADALQEILNPEQAALAVSVASGLVRGISKQTISFVPQETVILRGDTNILTLPQRPAVVGVGNPLTVVELGDFGGIDFTTVEGRDYVRVGNELERGHPWWYQSRLQGWPHRLPLGVWAPRVQVTYSHGFTVIPDEIVGLVLDIAKALYTNPTGLRSFTTPEYSETYARETLGATTVEGIKAQLSTMGFRRGAFSVG